MPNTREKLIEVKKALEFCFKQGMTSDCNGCAYKGHEGGVCMDVLMEDAFAVIKHLEEKQATSKWIPVTERLPDTAERVLVCKTWLGMVYKPVYGYYQDFPNQKGCWYVLTDEGYYPQREVTHWMPLPEPPKGE